MLDSLVLGPDHADEEHPSEEKRRELPGRLLHHEAQNGRPFSEVAVVCVEYSEPSEVARNGEDREAGGPGSGPSAGRPSYEAQHEWHHLILRKTRWDRTGPW